MGPYDQKELLTKYRISFLVNIVLLVIVFGYLFKLHQTGIPVDVVVYETQELAVKDLNTLISDELNAEATEGVLVIRKKEDLQADLTFYGKKFAGMTTGVVPDIKELVLQLGSGSTNAYAGEGCNSTFVYRGRIYCMP